MPRLRALSWCQSVSAFHLKVWILRFLVLLDLEIQALRRMILMPQKSMCVLEQNSAWPLTDRTRPPRNVSGKRGVIIESGVLPGTRIARNVSAGFPFPAKTSKHYLVLHELPYSTDTEIISYIHTRYPRNCPSCMCAYMSILGHKGMSTHLHARAALVQTSDTKKAQR